MEPVKVPLEKIVEGLKLDAHICDKELFAFVNRSLATHGLTAKVIEVSAEEVCFNVVKPNGVKDG